MESDSRFKHLVSDPRFRALRKKQRKVVIDERFKSMFEDHRFTLDYSQDKRGWRKKRSTSDNLKKYYSLEDDPKEDVVEIKEVEEEEDGVDKEVEVCEHDESVLNKEDEQSDEEGGDGDDDQSSSSVSTSSDESESDSDEVDIGEIKYDWQPLDHDAETADRTSRRLAIQNLDWDQLDIRDLYVLINSVLPPQKVTLYVSEFGKERLAQEEIKGPTELVEAEKEEDEEEELRQLEKKMIIIENQREVRKSLKPNEYEDADEALDLKNEQISSKIRLYQLNRMKYYYAIAEFESVESAEAVYKELDGREFEGTSIELDLRFVPDDVEFDQADERARCDKMPDLSTYKAPQFINSALQQTSVRFTWDETDVKRQEKLRRGYTEKELAKDDLEAYLASESDSDANSDDSADADEEEVNGNFRSTHTESERAQKYQRLLASLEEEAERKKKLDVDVEWGDFEADEARVSKKPDKVVRQPEAKEDEELDLLTMEAENKESCEFNPDDKRFEAVYTSGEFNIDPSHPSFKRTPAFDIIAERKRQRRMLSHT